MMLNVKITLTIIFSLICFGYSEDNQNSESDDVFIVEAQPVPSTLLEIPTCRYVNEAVETCETVTKPQCRIVSRRKKCSQTEPRQSCFLRRSKKCTKINRDECYKQCSNEVETVKKCKFTNVCKESGCEVRKVCYDKPLSIKKDLENCLSEKCTKCTFIDEQVCDGQKVEVIDARNCGTEEETVCRDIEEVVCTNKTEPKLKCNGFLELPVVK